MSGETRNVRRAITAVTALLAGAAVAGIPALPRAAASPAAPVAASAAPPAAPIVTSVIAEGLGLLVSWTPAAATDQVTSYQVTVVPAQGDSTPPAGCAGPVTITATGANSAALVPGLCAGVAYQASVDAVNGDGTSPASAASSPVVPLVAQVPQAPLITSVFDRPGALIVSWTAPASDGGKPLTGYTLTATAKGKKTVTVTAKASALTATIRGLADGTRYSVSLIASSPVGDSQSAAGAGVPAPARAPAGPGQVSASPDGTGTVTASWTPPADDGGDSITGYVLSWQQVVPAAKGPGFVPAPGSQPHTMTTSPSTSSVALPKADFSPASALYSISVSAVNAAGTGTAVATANPVSPVTTIAPHTTVLTAATMAALASDTPAPSGAGSILVWPGQGPGQVAGLAVGQVLVASPAPAAPNGLLDRVVNIGTDGSGNVAITTAPATLNDVFTTLAVTSTSDPLNETNPGNAFSRKENFIPAVAGIRDLGMGTAAGSGANFLQTLRLSFDYSGGDQKAGFSVKGEVDLTPNLSLNLAVDHGFAGVPDGVSVAASASVTLSSVIKLEAHFKYTQPIGEIDGSPITIPIGPVPLVIVPKVPITFSANGQLGLEVQASVTIGGSLAWDSRNPGKVTVANIGTPLKVTAGPLPGKTGEGNLVADLSVQPQLAIYDVGGPNVQGDAILTANVNFFPPPGGAFLKITPSLKLSAGLNVNLFGFKDSFEIPLLTATFDSFQILTPPPPDLVISPDSPEVQPDHSIQLTAARGDGKPSQHITWTLSGAATGDQISDTGLFTAAGPAQRTVTVTATDKAGATGSTVIEVGVPFDTVTKLAAVQNYNQQTALVSWSPPDSLGGSTLKGYLVGGDNGLPAQLTTIPQVNEANLRPGITYTITVIPLNTAGIAGPAASVTLRAIPVCSDVFTGKSAANPTAWSDKANWSAGAVPAASDWVCTDGRTVTLPARAISVEGLSEPFGTVTVPAGGSLTTTSSLVLTGTLSGPGTVTVPTGAIALLSHTPTLDGVRLVNEGSMEASGGPKTFSGSAVLDNSGTLTLDDEAGFNPAAGSSSKIINEASGSIVYEGFPTALGAAMLVPMTDSGSIESDSGTLMLGPVTGSGSPAFSGSGVISLEGTSVLPAGSSMAGLAGLIVDQPATLDVPGSLALALDADHVTVSGVLSGPGTVTLPQGSTSTFTGTFALAGGLRLVNDGSMEIQHAGGGQSFSGGSVLDNSGQVTLDYGANLSLHSGASGKLVNEAGGAVVYDDSRPFSSATIGVPFTDKGDLSITGGTVNVLSSLTLQAKTLTIGITGAKSFGQLAVSGTVTVDGTLAIDTADGYRPLPGTTLAIITSSSLSGTFAAVTGTQLAGSHWNVSYGPAAVTLKLATG